ncbi:hypothetical protein PG994_000792 [Apiospora phragmitis]|uniref:Uncharacterized protein n=1 Tax=Apiospora phragmitis TaxID=2905665 RepID=A0ABR1X7B7_9PEZI
MIPKQPIPLEALAAINFLLTVAYVALICHDDWSEIQDRVIAQLSSDSPDLTKLWFLPAGGTRIFGYPATADGLFECQNRWNLWSDDEFTTILSALDAALAAKGLEPEEVKGERVEYRGSSTKLHVLGRQADGQTKDGWDLGDIKRRLIVTNMGSRLLRQGLFPEGLLRDFEVRADPGDTIDVVRDDEPQRSACYHGPERITGIPRGQMLWVGRAGMTGRAGTGPRL